MRFILAPSPKIMFYIKTSESQFTLKIIPDKIIKKHSHENFLPISYHSVNCQPG